MRNNTEYTVYTGGTIGTIDTNGGRPCNIDLGLILLMPLIQTGVAPTTSTLAYSVDTLVPTTTVSHLTLRQLGQQSHRKQQISFLSKIILAIVHRNSCNGPLQALQSPIVSFEGLSAGVQELVMSTERIEEDNFPKVSSVVKMATVFNRIPSVQAFFQSSMYPFSQAS